MYPYRPITIQPQRRRRRPRQFTKDIETLLYGMGDGPGSSEDTVNCLEDCLVEYLTNICHEASQFARSHGRTRIKIDDIPFALRNDPSKLGKLSYIREHVVRIEKAKKQYDFNKINEKELFADEDEDEQEDAKPVKKARKKSKKKSKEAKDSDSE